MRRGVKRGTFRGNWGRRIRTKKNTNVANWVRGLRRKLRVTQADLAKMVGVTNISVHFWEHGRVAPRAAHRARLAKLDFQRREK